MRACRASVRTNVRTFVGAMGRARVGARRADRFPRRIAAARAECALVRLLLHVTRHDSAAKPNGLARCPSPLSFRARAAVKQRSGIGAAISCISTPSSGPPLSPAQPARERSPPKTACRQAMGLRQRPPIGLETRVRRSRQRPQATAALTMRHCSRVKRLARLMRCYVVQPPS